MAMDRERLTRMAGFLAPLSDPHLQFMDETTSISTEEATIVLPGSYAPIVEDFLELCTQDGWIKRGFNWSEWIRTDEARVLLQDSGAIASATLDQISMILTALVRQERFCNGALHEVHRTGFLQRVLARVADLASSPIPIEDIS